MIGPDGPAGPSLAPPEDPALVEIVRLLIAELSPERIYLFGSRARGDAVGDSDYDVMVLVGYAVERAYPLEVRALRALRGIRTAVEVLVMNSERFDWLSGAAASLPATIKREGRLLYGG